MYVPNFIKIASVVTEIRGNKHSHTNRHKLSILISKPRQNAGHAKFIDPLQFFSLS